MSDLPTNLIDNDPAHTAGHNAANAQTNTNSRPATVNAVTHAVAGALALDAEDGHIALVTVSANITSITTPTNMVNGLPFLLILKGNGVAAFTANLANINLNSSTALTATQNVASDSLLHINFVKDGFDLWAPAGVLDWGGAAPGAGIVHINSAALAYTGASTTAPVYTLPTNYASGDLLEVIAITQESTDPGAPSTPAGWTREYTNVPLSSFYPRITKLRKISNGAEGTTLTLTGSPSARYHGGSSAYRGVDQTTPYDATETLAETGPNIDPAAITTVTANALVIVEAACNVPGGATATLPTGYTERINTDTDDRSLITCDKIVAVAGAENPAAFSWATNSSATCRTSALRPA